MKKIEIGTNRRFGAIKNIGISLKLRGIDDRMLLSGPEAAYRVSEEARNHLLEMEQQKIRARTEAQRFQLNR